MKAKILTIRFMLLGCLGAVIISCAPMVTFENMGPSLDKRIGQPAPNLSEDYSRYYQYRDVDDKTYELLWKRPDACSYVLEIGKVDNIITGWHYLESNPPSDCKFQNVRQLM